MWCSWSAPPNSSNANRLREIAAQQGVPAYLIDGPEEIRAYWLRDRPRVGATADASVPESLGAAVVQRLTGEQDGVAREGVELEEQREDTVFALPAELRDAVASRGGREIAATGCWKKSFCAIESSDFSCIVVDILGLFPEIIQFLRYSQPSIYQVFAMKTICHQNRVHIVERGIRPGLKRKAYAAGVLLAVILGISAPAEAQDSQSPLTGLTVTDASGKVRSLRPNFSIGVTQYTVSVDGSVDGVTVTPTGGAGSTVTVGDASPLEDGESIIDVVVADDTNTTTYKIYIMPDGFVTTWEVDANETITIPTHSDSDYDYVVHWGDGSRDIGQRGDASHTYADAGSYQVSVSGFFPRIYFGGSGNCKITRIEKWGNIAWESMEGTFYGCEMLWNIDDNAGIPNLSNVANLEFMFRNATLFNGNIGDWDVSSVTNMRGMFYSAGAFNRDISDWNVSNVTDMRRMFKHTNAFNQDIGNWDVSSVTNMRSMFYDANAFNQDIGN